MLKACTMSHLVKLDTQIGNFCIYVLGSSKLTYQGNLLLDHFSHLLRKMVWFGHLLDGALQLPSQCMCSCSQLLSPSKSCSEEFQLNARHVLIMPCHIPLLGQEMLLKIILRLMPIKKPGVRAPT